MHDARGDGRPLGVLFSRSFACNHFEFQLLVFAKLHDYDRIEWLSRLVVHKFDWADLQLLLGGENVK